MKKILSIMIGLQAALLPNKGLAQGFPSEIRGLHQVLNNLYTEMLPMCSSLIAVGRGIAGFAALFYIGARVWRHIANAEPVDFFPLFRPFVLGFCILIFPQVIAIMNGILSPTVIGTSQLVDNTNASLQRLMAQREKERQQSPFYKMYGINEGSGNRDIWMQYTHPDKVGNEGVFGSLGYDVEFAVSKAYYNLKSWFKDLLSFLLQVLYESAALCINTIRTFKLLIFAILGPLVFGLAVFDGFQHTLSVYLARYINVYLWLPIANILGALLGKIQEGMIKLDISQVEQNGDSFFSSSDIGYIVFLIIGIASYFTIPSIANMIVNAGGGGALTSRVTKVFFGGAGSAASTSLAVGAAGAGMVADAFGDVNARMNQSMSDAGTNSRYFEDKVSGKS
ncbi:MAG: conjugative transposon protein TraJ [Chitinophagaceae bacterium]|nr:conjugative transposon protein TraJ [Chitinophagaceae bacterium]